MSGKIIKTSIISYEHKKDIRQYEKQVKHRGSFCIPFEEFPDNFPDVGEYKKLFLLSFDNDSIVNKSDIVNLHGKKMLMAFIKAEKDKFMYSIFLCSKNNLHRPGEIIINVSISTNDKDYAQKEINKLYSRKIDWV